MSFERWSRIILPEIQLVDYIKQHGFRKKSDKIGNQISSIQKGFVTNRGTTTPISTKHSSPISGSAVKEGMSDSKKGFQHLRTTENVHNLDEVFERINQGLAQSIYDQTAFLNNLTTAFKKAFLTRRKGIVQHTILMAGPEGTGKMLALSLLIEKLYQQRLIPYRKVMEIDLSSYSEKEVNTNFISDVAAAFEYGIGTVCFKGASKAHSDILRYVASLVTKGYFRTEAGITVEAADYFIVFSIEDTVNNEPDALTKLPEKLQNSIKTVLITQPLSMEALEQLAKQLLAKVNQHLQNNALISFTYDDKVIAFLAQQAIQSQQFGTSLHFWIEEKLSNGLIDLRARNFIKQNEQMALYKEGNELFVKQNGKSLPVLSIVPDKGENIEQIMKELDNLIGLGNVKGFVKELMNTVEIQSRRKQSGQEDIPLTLHMIFSGNPGTGKTTVARMVGKLLKSMGILSKGQLIETARQDLVGEYLGSTAPKTNQKIQEAIGGVLFIDEAYTLSRDKNDPFGQEAIDTLVKGMEDYREDLVVILAGYTNEMGNFLSTNPGLPSRFPFQVEFLDYKPEEMVKMAHMMANQRGYQIDEIANSELVGLFAKKQIPGRNDSGNGRLVRNLLEEAIRKQAARIVELGEEQADLNLLMKEDFGIIEEQPFNLEENLDEIIGLEHVKTFLRTLEKQILVNKRRKEAGITVKTDQTLNMIFYGNPGTGKTTIARCVSLMLKNLDVLKKGHLVEVGRTELVSGYVGQTAEKTKEVVESALGGVLFIDEAYALVDKSNGGVGEEAINELVRLIEIHRENLIVILAGYTEEMKDFFRVNPGLASRFPLQLEFPDYTADEMVQMTNLMVQARGFYLDEGVHKPLKVWYENKQIAGKKDIGNGRLVRNTIEKAIRTQAVRIADEIELPNEELTLLTKYDFGLHKQEVEQLALDELEKIVGLEEVKNFVKSLSAQIEMNARRKALGLPDMASQSLHMVFKGNPGTGKTTIARIVAKRLKELGVVKTDNVVETDRSGLVAGYVGQTALKTKEVIDRALGGVLFIDEAYSLSSDSFGKEAIDTLVKAMEDYQNELVVIVAGYEDEMEQFLNVNPGLRSRFPNIITFKDYRPSELLKISRLILHGKGYKASKHAEEKMLMIFKTYEGRTDSGNGRLVRNICEQAIRNHAMRFSGDLNASVEQLTTIEVVDLPIEKGGKQ